ncbi:hypothetical protein E2320_009966 [Naja naja]|nr:hypothetical protein E2320_009966 [Naja naja]
MAAYHHPSLMESQAMNTKLEVPNKKQKAGLRVLGQASLAGDYDNEEMIRFRENKLSIQVGQKQELKIARPKAQKSKHGFEGSESSEQTSNEFNPKLKLGNLFDGKNQNWLNILYVTSKMFNEMELKNGYITLQNCVAADKTNMKLIKSCLLIHFLYEQMNTKVEVWEALKSYKMDYNQQSSTLEQKFAVVFCPFPICRLSTPDCLKDVKSSNAERKSFNRSKEGGVYLPCMSYWRSYYWVSVYMHAWVSGNSAFIQRKKKDKGSIVKKLLGSGEKMGGNSEENLLKIGGLRSRQIGNSERCEEEAKQFYNKEINKHRILTLFKKLIFIPISMKKVSHIGHHLTEMMHHKMPERLPEGTQILLLQSNNIVKVEQSELDYLKNLTELDLSQNSFSDIWDFGLKNMPHLLSLHLEENQLAELPDNSFSSLANLQELYLNHNQIRRISPQAFLGLGNLLRLHLNSNFLRTIDSRWFQVLPSLEILMIGGNKVDAILDMNFRALSNLRSLVLAGMNLREISDYALVGLKNLESLSFYDNNLISVPKRALQQVPGLKFLDLNKNPLQRIKQSDFTNMLHLKELGLNNMEELVSIDKFALINLPELTKLDVTNNPKLSYIHPSAFHHLPQMETLMLNNNALSALHKQTLESLPSLQEISIHSNPLHCDCVIRWVNSTENHIRFIEPQSTLCAEPPDLKRKHIRDVPFREMTDRCLPLISDKSFPSHLDVVDGEDISLHCRALAEPEPEIYWVTPSGLKLLPFSEDGKYKVDSEGTMEIHKVTIQEAGLYTCMAQNLIGADTRSISLIVNRSFPFSKDVLELIIEEVQTYNILVSWKPHLNTISSNLTWSSFNPSLDLTNVARIPIESDQSVRTELIQITLAACTTSFRLIDWFLSELLKAAPPKTLADEIIPHHKLTFRSQRHFTCSTVDSSHLLLPKKEATMCKLSPSHLLHQTQYSQENLNMSTVSLLYDLPVAETNHVQRRDTLYDKRNHPAMGLPSADLDLDYPRSDPLRKQVSVQHLDSRRIDKALEWVQL